MRLTKSQVSRLSKWANGGRLIVQPIMPPEDIPEWAKREFDLARAMTADLKELSRLVARQEKASGVA